MFGKRFEPVVAEARETMTSARASIAALVLLGVATLAVSLLTLMMVSSRD